MLKVFWIKTGDYIDLDVLHPELVEFWLDKVADCELKLTRQPPNVTGQEILSSINIINPLLIKLRLPTFDLGDPLDQGYLNKLHRDWVKLQQNHPNIAVLMDKLALRKEFDSVNELIHETEQPFSVEYETLPIKHAVNPFGTRYLTFDKNNFEIEYSNLGRSTFNKWLVLDENVHDTDTNDYTHIGTRLKINVERPVTNKPLVDAVGDRLPIGSCVHTVDDLSMLRKLVLRNAQEQDNGISFEFLS